MRIRLATQEDARKIRNAVRHILEAEGFKMEYKFMGNWCFYSKEM